MPKEKNSLNFRNFYVKIIKQECICTFIIPIMFLKIIFKIIHKKYKTFFLVLKILNYIRHLKHEKWENKREIVNIQVI